SSDLRKTLSGEKRRCPSPLLPVFFEYGGGDMSSKTKRIVHGIIHGFLDSLIEREVEMVKARFDLPCINGGWDNVFLHGFDGSNGLHRAGRSQQVACHGFGRADMKLAVPAENPFHRFQLAEVSLRCGGGMGVQVVNLSGIG